MPNLCITNYVIIGNQTDIKFLHKNLKQTLNSSKTVLSKIARAFCPNWTNHLTMGYLADLALNNPRQISFTVHTVSKPEPGLWFEICRKYHTSKCYYYSAVAESHHYSTNDKSGKFFPHRYMIADSNGNIKAVVSHNELFRQAALIVDISDKFDTLEAFGKTVSAHLSHIYIFDILVVDTRGKCITANPLLIGQYLNEKRESNTYNHAIAL